MSEIAGKAGWRHSLRLDTTAELRAEEAGQDAADALHELGIEDELREEAADADAARSPELARQRHDSQWRGSSLQLADPQADTLPMVPPDTPLRSASGKNPSVVDGVTTLERYGYVLQGFGTLNLPAGRRALRRRRRINVALWISVVLVYGGIAALIGLQLPQAHAASLPRPRALPWLLLVASILLWLAARRMRRRKRRIADPTQSDAAISPRRSPAPSA